MPTNAIPGGEAYSFRGRDLHGNLQEITDADEQDVAVHRILKRDGAIVEGMGWNARRFVAKHAFVGADFRSQVADLRTFIRKESEGTLVHPLYGRLNARCTKIEGALNIPEGSNSAMVSLSYVEAGIDPKADAAPTQGVAAKAQGLTAQSDTFATLAAVYTSSASVSAAATLTDQATAFASAASDVLTLGVPDPSLPLYVGSIESAALAAITAIIADPAASTDPDRFDALAAADLVYAAAIDLAAAVAATRPQLAPYVVPAPIGYLALMSSFYGDEALERGDELLINNPGLTTPHLIPAGTVLLMAPPTV